MRKSLAALFLLSLLCDPGFADILKMKSGQYKRGTIMDQEGDVILFKSDTDGAVVEVPKSDVSLAGRDLPPDGSSKGKVSFFTVTPDKDGEPAKTGKENTPLPAKSKGPAVLDRFFKSGSQAEIFGKAERMLKEWVEKYPEMKQWFEGFENKQAEKSEELEKLSEAANSA